VSIRFASRAAWSSFVVSAALMTGAVVFRFLSRSAEVTPDLGTWRTALAYAVVGLLVPALGALICSRRPENPIGWMFCAIGLVTGVELAAEGYAVYALLGEPGAVPGGTVAAWMANWTGTLGIGLLPFVFLLFPDGRLPSPRWRPVAWFAAALYVFLPVGYALLPGPLGSFPGVQNPFGHAGGDAEIVPGIDQVFAWMALVVAVLLSVVSLVARLRRASGAERQQIKWVAYAAVVLVFYVLIDLFFQDRLTPVVPVLDTLLVGGFYAAITVAILKYRLYDIDLLINRTLVYAALTAALGLIYLCVVVVLQRTLVLLSGEGSQLAVVASTLAIAALFNPLRKRTQHLVDRRFYRNKYDAAKAMESFSAKLRDGTNLGTLREDLLRVIEATVAPEHVSLWMVPATGARDARGDDL
jgi:hypothetical protein